MKKERNSNFELLRIIAMLFIVIYHLLITVFSKNPTEII
jgi:peptidoglycan/LPS O-acetylase OafA/YrhL